MLDRTSSQARLVSLMVPVLYIKDFDLMSYSLHSKDGHVRVDLAGIESFLSNSDLCDIVGISHFRVANMYKTANHLMTSTSSMIQNNGVFFILPDGSKATPLTSPGPPAKQSPTMSFFFSRLQCLLNHSTAASSAE